MLAVTQILMMFYYLIVPRNWWINIFSLATSYVALVLYIQLFLPILICLIFYAVILLAHYVQVPNQM